LKLLLDTHVWLWSVLDPAKLSRRVSSALESADNELWLSPMSLWEALLLEERGRVRLGADPVAWLEKAFETASLREAPLNRRVAVESRRVRLSHQDPVDRFLAATAVVYELTLVTADERLLRAKDVPLLANR
jgi:PIN domain nuclease of toxin-antitoxin system